MHLTRYYMYRRLAPLCQGRLSGRILGISGIANFKPWISPSADVTEVFYPDVDMQRLPYPDASFDAVISDQVIAHLDNPRLALSEAFRVLKPGGLGIHTTRASGAPDLTPQDHYRFTPSGLLATCPPGLEVLQLESWGNRYVMALLCLHDRFFRFAGVPERPGLRRWLATRNDPAYPIHTWIVARKPL